MTKFKQPQRSSEQWEDAAIDAVESVGTSPQLLAVCGFAGGVLVAGFSPIAALGLVPVALGLKAAVDVNNKRSRMEVAIEQGAIAAVLPLPELREYSQQYGIDAAIEQISWAKSAGIPLSESAESLLSRYRQKYKALAQSAPDAPQTLNAEATATDAQQAIAPSAIPTNAAEVLARLKAECPELLKLVKAPPIRIVGHQRTGKSTFARIICLLRMLFLEGHKVRWATPHFEEDDPVPPQLNPFGSGMNYSAIEAVWKETQQAIGTGKLNLSIVWDEFGGYDAFEDQSLLGESLRSLLRDSTKHGYHPILIAHGDQASFYPGVTGILTTLKAGTVKVETIGEPVNDFGEMRPTGKATITHLDGNSADIALPSWLTDKFLLSLLPTAAPIPSEVSATVPTAAPQAPATASAPVPSYQATPTPIAPPAAPLPSPGDEYKATEKESPTVDQTIRRIALKLAEKFKEANRDWVSMSELTKKLFNNTDDRQKAKELVDRAVANGRLESEERENPNRTKTIFVRVKSANSVNTNPPQL